MNDSQLKTVRPDNKKRGKRDELIDIDRITIRKKLAPELRRYIARSGRFSFLTGRKGDLL